MFSGKNKSTWKILCIFQKCPTTSHPSKIPTYAPTSSKPSFSPSHSPSGTPSTTIPSKTPSSAPTKDCINFIFGGCSPETNLDLVIIIDDTSDFENYDLFKMMLAFNVEQVC